MTTITVCVPVYNGAAFVGETLQHLAAQTFRDFNVMVSVDLSDDNSIGVCRAFECDHRFRVIEQKKRLGWVGNVNALIDLVKTPLFCIHPHDDLLDATYLQTMHDVLANEPQTVCAYSDVLCFGELDDLMTQPDVTGTRHHRVLDILLNHFNAIAFRGVIRLGTPGNRPRLSTVMPHDFAVDTAWMMLLATRGDLRRVALPLCRKRFASSSVHASWNRRTREELRSLYAQLIVTCARIALDGASNESEREEILAAGLLRSAGYTKCPSWGTPATPLDITLATAEYSALIAEAEISANVDRILAGTQMDVLRDAPNHHIMLESMAEQQRGGVLQRAKRKLESMLSS